MSVSFDVVSQLYIKRQDAVDKMGERFYKGEEWFICKALWWLPRVLGSVCVERKHGNWRVKVDADEQEYVEGDSLEQALMDAVLATVVPPAL